MIFSISLRCAPEMLCAWPADAPSVSMRPAARARRGREAHGDQSFRYRGVEPQCGLKPMISSALTQPGEPIGKRVLARAASWRAVLMVAAHERGLRRGEIGLRKVALAAIGHGELGIAVDRFGLAGKRGAQQRDRLVGGLRRRSMAIQRLRQHDLDQRRLGRKLDGAPQRRDRLGGLAAFEQRLALQFMEIRIVRLRPGSGRRSGRWRRAGRHGDRSRWRAHSAPAGWCRSRG